MAQHSILETHLWTSWLIAAIHAMQVAFRWAGDANIGIAIELPAGGEHTRMVPKVTDLQVAGVARVILSPLVPVIPGFGAAIVALRCFIACSSALLLSYWQP